MAKFFILDMGEPVKIADLARKMVVQAGLKPDIDIPFDYVGLRPGEKLYEELLLIQKLHTKTPNKKIFIEKRGEDISVNDIIDNLKLVLDQESKHELKVILSKMVSTYTIKE